MFKVLTGVRVVSAQEGAAHAAVDNVVPGRIGQGNEGAAGAGHGVSVGRADYLGN